MYAKQRAIELEESGCYVAAAILLKSVVDVAPEDSFAWLVLSDCLKAMGQLTRCREALEQVLVHSPSDHKWIVFVRLAMLERKRGHFQEADHWFIKASLEEGARDYHWVNILRAANLILLEDFAAAEQVIRSVIENGSPLDDPDEAYNILGLSLLGQDKYLDARDALTTSFRLAENSEIPKRALMATESIEEAQLIVDTSGKNGVGLA